MSTVFKLLIIEPGINLFYDVNNYPCYFVFINVNVDLTSGRVLKKWVNPFHCLLPVEPVKRPTVNSS